jgi:hypothetical protein
MSSSSAPGHRSPGSPTRSGVADARVAGSCRAVFAFDLAFSLNLDAISAHLVETVPRRLARDRRRSPAWFQYEPPPLNLMREAPRIALGAFTTEPGAEVTLFDFGAVSVSFPIPLETTLDRLPALGETLYDNASLLAEARRLLEELLPALGPGAAGATVSDFYEDYAIFAIRSWDRSRPVSGLVAGWGSTLASMLAADTGPLSEQQVEDALAGRLGYTPDDLTIVGWNGAVVFDEDPADAILLLEHANVALVELRYVDGQLDTLLERSRGLLSRQSRFPIWPLGAGSRDLRKLTEVQVDSALMFEGMNNAIKLVGDQYLARLYRVAAEKLHLPDWNASVLRKLETATSMFGEITDRQTSRRMEVLEVIIIVLILIEVVRPFVPALGG